MSVAKYIIPHGHTITKENRQELKGHKSCILWYTGCPAQVNQLLQ